MLDALQFIDLNGYLPRLGDHVSPWQYRGWLLPYVAGIHEHMLFRWPYLLDTLAAGKFLDTPIPKVRYTEPNRKVFRDIQDWCQIIGYDGGGWTDFVTLLEWLLFALRLSEEYPKRISEEKQEKLYRAVNIGPMLETPYDYLGSIVSEHKANGWNPMAFYPTPHAVCDMMVEMTFHDIDPTKVMRMADGRDTRAASVNEPCVGSGRMLLHASNYSMNLTGQDSWYVAVQMTLINGALYAPWISFPLPSTIIGEQAGIDYNGILI